MQLQTRIFDLCDEKYRDLSELARAMEIPESQIDRIRECKYQINQRFIAAAIKAFPDHKLDELFYFAPDIPDSPERDLSLILESCRVEDTSNGRHPASVH
jgi:hypothetical protein